MGGWGLLSLLLEGSVTARTVQRAHDFLKSIYVFNTDRWIDGWMNRLTDR